MNGCAYLFERFPSFTQTFCYREVAELRRQGFAPAIFSIRRPKDEPPQDWDPAIVAAVEYMPNDEALTHEIERALRKNKLPPRVAREIATWGRQTDFLRLYQAAWLGPRLQAFGVRRVHAHFAGLAARTAYWIARFFGIEFSFTAHANDIFAPKPFAISLGDLIAAASAVVTVSDFGVDFLREKYPDAEDKIHRVYNGIDLGRFPRSDFSATPPLILSVGRLIEKKAFADLIAACALLAGRGTAFQCEIIGEGPLQSALQEQIRARGLTNSISLCGPLPQTEVIRRLACSTVFALPCVTETEGGMDNLPTVIVEAMAAGLPVVSTVVAGVPEMVQEGATGYLIPEHEPTKLADALARLLADRDLAQSLGKSGHERAERIFSIDQTTRALCRLLSNAT